MDYENYVETLMQKFRVGDSGALNEVFELFKCPVDITCQAILNIDTTMKEEEIQKLRAVFLRDFQETLSNNCSQYNTLKDVRMQCSHELGLIVNCFENGEFIETGQAFISYFDRFFELVELMHVKKSLFTRYFFTKVSFLKIYRKLCGPAEFHNISHTGLKEIESMFVDENEKKYYLALLSIRAN